MGGISIKDVYDSLGSIVPKRMVVAGAADGDVLHSVIEAHRLGIVQPILVGDPSAIAEAAACGGYDIGGFEVVQAADDEAAARLSASLVSAGQADILMKGLLPSGIFLKAVMARDAGFRISDRIVNTMAVVEMKETRRVFFVTDPGMNPMPGVEEKAGIIRNTVEVACAFGIKRPKVACLCASETVSERIPATVEAAMLEAMGKAGDLGDCEVAGPLSLDLAVSEESAAHKGYEHPVAGRADILLCPSIEAANILYKSMAYFSRIESGGVMAGTAAPVVFMSRTDSVLTKRNTIAFAAYLARSGDPG